MKQNLIAGAEVWWINPGKAIALLLIPAYVLLFLTPTIFGPGAVRLTFRTYWTGEYFFLGLLFLVVAALGAWIGLQLKPNPDKAISQSAPIRLGYLDFLAICSLLAYFIWFHRLFLRPWVMVEALLGQSGIWLARSQNPTIPGLTTMTQFGVAYVICYFDRIWGAQQPVAWRHQVFLWTLFVLTTLRVYVWAERIALIELVVPIVLAYLVYKPGQPGAIKKAATLLGPILGVVALVLFFAVTEFFRSWSAAYHLQYESFWRFILQRLTSYYYTALNNGAGALTINDWPSYKMTGILSWLYEFPAMIGPIFRFTMDAPRAMGPLAFLERYADPEFNNPSGIFWVFLDVGVAGAMLYALLWGAVAGYCYRTFRMGQGIGRVLFPLVYISILEIFKNLYLSSTRAFPIVLTVLIGYVFFKDLSTRRPEAIHPRRAKSHTAIARAPSWAWSRLIRPFARR